LKVPNPLDQMWFYINFLLK